jgi:TolB-like protein/DNA-binding winged helix-turn-helix (wHTH) protein
VLAPFKIATNMSITAAENTRPLSSRNDDIAINGTSNPSQRHEVASPVSVQTLRILAVREKMQAGEVPRMYQFGEFEVADGEVRRQGVKIKLNDKPHQVLCILLERAGSLVTRDELRQRLWTSDTFVDFDANLNTALSTLRHALGDSAENPIFIETVPRQGYRFTAPVHVISPELRPAAKPVEQIPETQPHFVPRLARDPDQRIHWSKVVAVAALFIAVLGAGIWLASSKLRPKPVATAKITILVTPFENLSGDAAQDYLSDGLTDEMITRLGQIAPGRVTVIPRSTSMRYKHTQKSIEQIVGECRPDYILEGSLRRQTDRVRITVQLFKAGEKGSMWTEAYDRDARDLLVIQEEVADRVAHSVSLELPIAARL